MSEYSCLNNYIQIGMKIEIDIDDKTFSICTIDENEEEIGRSLVYDIKTGKIYHNIISINNKWYYEKDFTVINKDKNSVEKSLILDKKIILKKIFYNEKCIDFKLFKSNKLYGFREIRDNNGKLLLRGSYLNGKKIGLWYEYENGKIIYKASFDEKERLCGLCKEYDLNGKLLAKEIYLKGNLIKRIEI
ncbi:toxin-antitoxin system YwqK family antitoxin [Leptotrichia sp. oral taxon 847]|uniref:toxin-antitoxin system YwqK family antitoxin n=1 Tax=Leptotrichia sp. oral taxon 847 TaxID=1785996 RepID=UPI0007684095|nr:hypothetical protein [Leptotrichia sp. oral taxon 847]AMD95205.1 hypothetical protein AXF11_06190 [Leptotrichia sp. oral taxon 847]